MPAARDNILYQIAHFDKIPANIKGQKCEFRRTMCKIEQLCRAWTERVKRKPPERTFDVPRNHATRAVAASPQAQDIEPSRSPKGRDER